jgi:hypothetical protein
MESVTNRYVDFGPIQFCCEVQQLHVLSILPFSEWERSLHLHSGLLCREASF